MSLSGVGGASKKKTALDRRHPARRRLGSASKQKGRQAHGGASIAPGFQPSLTGATTSRGALRLGGRGPLALPRAVAAHRRNRRELRYLSLGCTRITDAGLAHLKGLLSLEQLDLLGAKITYSRVAELQNALPNCKITFQLCNVSPAHRPLDATSTERVSALACWTSAR